MDKELRILILEDVETDAELVERELRRGKIPFTSKRVWTKEAFLKEIDAFTPNIILADFNLPQFNALDALKLLQGLKADIPFILVTGSQSEEVAAECIKEGADDYLLKQSLKRLPTAITNALKKIEAEREKEKAEAQIQTLYELGKVRDVLAGMIVHDLRNPLSAVMGYIQIMEMQNAKLDDKMKEYIQNANNSCLRLLEMINQIVDIVRMEDERMPIKLMKRDLVPIIRIKVEQYTGTAQANGIKIKAEMPSQAVELDIDSLLIERMLENLISNAVKHTPSGGDITVGLEVPTDKKIILLWVKDTGEGIPPEYHNTIFEKYGHAEIKTKMGRVYDTGLGLVFCRMAAELHGGKIYVNSEVGKGSTFTVELPLKK
ncbi:MAG: hypothetical protein A2W23_08375 [Planctomycetes bacterium RBG_16_43_13]|nr:MAG: hypothetical protein A2W23_08375 [Planctomycetes bacterium RBG_16_43_13]